MPITLNGYIQVPDDRLAIVTAGLDQHIRLSRAEAGCIRFSVTRSEQIKGRFIVSEVFVDQAAFDLHQSRTAASEWAKITKDIPRSYEVKEIAAHDLDDL